MSKQRKTPEQAPAERRAEAGRSREVEAGREGGALGNAAVQDQISGLAAEGAVGLDVVRDVAAPMVDRAALALQLYPRERAQVERFVTMLERSNLPVDRKAALIDRLKTDEAAALAVSEVVTRHFGADGEDVRGALVDALDAVGRGLAEGSPDAGSWRVGGHEVATAAVDGAVSARAEALLAGLTAHLVTGLAAQADGAGIAGLCRDLNVALWWDEEEEEEALVDVGPEEG